MSKKPSSAFLDSNVFIYARLENCNSRLIVFLAQLGEVEVCVSELVVEEVELFFREEVSREAAYLARCFVESIAKRIVRRENITKELRQLKGRIKDRDLENLAALRHEKLSYLVSYDDDYQKARVKEYVTPKEFVKLFGLAPYPVEY